MIGLGTLFLVGLLFDFDNFGLFVLPALATIFTLWAIFTKSAGLFIPAGVFVGISLGIGLISSPLATRVSEDGGLFLIGFAAGWVYMTVMSAIFSRETHWWALIPAGILGFIGTAVLTVGGYTNFEWPIVPIGLCVYLVFPIVLIGLGVYLVFRRQDEISRRFR